MDTMPASTRTSAWKANSFAFDFLMNHPEKEGNLFFSPYSLFAAMSMVWVGARGDTQMELERLLRISEDDGFLPSFKKFSQRLGSDECEISIANAAWIRKGFSVYQDYKDILIDSFKAMVVEMDFDNPFKVCRIVNDWVNGATRGMIPEILTHDFIDSMTRLILANAVYFKGKWEKEFSKEATEDSLFYRKSGPITVPMMYAKGDTQYFKGSVFQAVRLPYKGGTSMVVFLPIPCVTIEEMERSLDLTMKNSGTIVPLFSSEKVRVFLPKFKMSIFTDAKPVLQAAGAKLVFGDGCELGSISRKPLYVSDVLHKAAVEVDEGGTKAAAATVVMMKRYVACMTASAPLEVFRADRPFFFTIIDDKTNAILFMGRVQDPTKDG